MPTLRARGISEPLERRNLLSIESSIASISTTVDSELVLQSVQGGSRGDGSSVVVYSDRDSVTGKGKDVFVRRFNASGAPIAAASAVNTTTGGAQMNPDVAVSSNGTFVVVWQSEGQDGSSWGVYGRRFDASGNAAGGEFLINTSTSGVQTAPKVAIDSSGNFAVSYLNEASGNGEILVRRYNAAGTALGEATVSGATTKAYSAPVIAMAGPGAYAVAWVRTNIDTDNSTDVQLRVFNAAGASVGSVQTIDDAGDQAAPSLAAGFGQFSLAWADESSSEATIFLRSINAAGTWTSSAIQANQDSLGNRTRPRVDSDLYGNVVVGWTQQEADVLYSSTVYRSFDVQGTAMSNEIAVTDGSSARTLMDLVLTAQGRFLDLTTLGEFVGYGLGSQSGFANAIRLDGTGGNDVVVAYDLDAATIRAAVNGVAQNYYKLAYAYVRSELGDGNDLFAGADLSLMATVSGGTGNDSITTGGGFDSISGGDGNDSIRTGGGSDYAIGNGGNDSMYGEAGDDTLTGSAGKDLLYGGDGNDRLAGLGSPDRVFGESGDDRIYGDDGDDRVDGGGGKDRVYGGEGADYLEGGSSNDRLYGQNGNDTLIGGKGNDYLAGDAGIDTVLSKEDGDTILDIEVIA